MYSRPRRIIGAWPTHDGLTVTYIGMPAADFDHFHAEPDAALLEAFDQAGDLGERARAAKRVAPVRGTTDLPNRIRVSAGPGWALAGDAGLVMDPGSGQGMGHALQDAEALADVVVTGLGGSGSPSDGLTRYQRERDRKRLPMYRFTLDLAGFSPRPGSDLIFEALASDPDRTAEFFGVLAGTRSPDVFFAGRNLRRILGWRGFFRLVSAGGRPGDHAR